VAEQQSANRARHRAVRERPGLRRFFLACGAIALLMGSIALYLAPPREAFAAVVLQTTIIPASILALIALNQRGNRPLLVLTVVLLWAEAILTAALYTIGVSFAIVIPLIGIGIVQPYLSGTATKLVYIGAGIVSTISVTLFAMGIQPNPLSQPGIAVVGFALLSAFALGLVWRAGDRWVEALDAADREISARVAAEQELEKTARLLATLVSSSPVATLTIERDMTISTWNEAAQALVGMPATEVLGEPVEAGLPPFDDGVTPRDVIGRAMGGDVVVADLVRTARRDGSELLVEIHAAIRRDERGKPVGVVAQVIDVTERARLEASLRQSQRMEAVGRLAGVVAHELNNAMMAVGGYAEFIKSDSRDPEAVANAQKIIGAADRASRMTRQLLVSAGQSRFEPQVVDIVAIIGGLQDELKVLLGPQIRLDVRHGIESGFVLVDPDPFGETIRSLALRARDTMPDGGTLTISTSRTSGDGDVGSVIVVGLTDTGAPIEPDVAERLFDPFLTTGVDPRTGLELAMAFGVVRQSDGEIDVRAASTGGSTIEIRLPEIKGPVRPSGGP
jgi:PAS domain S-box-containing protein